MKKYFFLLNDFSHDLFTGLWICSLLTIYLVNSKLQQYIQSMQNVILQDFGSDLSHTFFYLQSWSLILIMVTGVVRLYHVKAKPRHKDKKERTILLIAKHIILGVLFGAGSWLGYTWTF